ncbi:recombinase family protein [Catelliglobosispora koreensis]|uniref:recombinase family protein n=1 Tax=Catelliglobosispora koreensis TaxID=129052 RepID=UPI0003A0D422|nr:recombinase family protein [Catelliglobosispora koreensis]
MTNTMRFAFYGRVSTEDNQDPESSFNWQRTLAQNLITPYGGQIVENFFDVGESRSIPWQRRPEASRLLKKLKDPKRGFDHIVIGEPHRAFYGNQFGLTLPLLEHYKVTLWVPEMGGAIDPRNEVHELMMSIFGGMSKGERNRVKTRVRNAMVAQTEIEGRFLGGRPPYGYKLKDLGPHPNPAKAADGRMLHGLTPDPVTAPVVMRIFAAFLNGAGMYAIAEDLTEEGIPCPSAYDRKRNPHRTGLAWSKGAVRTILTNPRYTGRQVWNKQRTDEVLLDVDDVAQGHTQVMRWNKKEDWIISKNIVHEPIVDEDSFDQAQEMLGYRRKHGHTRRVKPSKHPYVFKSLIFCGLCGRKMQGLHAHDIKYYRCRYPAEYARANRVDHPKNIILREDAIEPAIDLWLTKSFSPTARDQTINDLASQLNVGPKTPPGQHPTKTLDAKMARYKAALDAGADPAVVTKWIKEAQDEFDQQRKTITQPKPKEITTDDIRTLINQLGDIAQAIKDAIPEDKWKVYRALDLRLTYAQETQTVLAEIDLGEHRWGIDRVRGGT